MENTQEVLDYFSIPINIGDRVIFPAGAEQMEGEVTKIRYNTKNPKSSSVTVKNNSGYSKLKKAYILINVTAIKDLTPEYRL